MGEESGVWPPDSVEVQLPHNPEVGRIYGPKGDLVRVVRARPQQPVGFRRRSQEASCRR